MPSATSEKLNQLRAQLQDCTNPKVAKLLKSAIAKLEAQLNPGQVQAKAAKAKSSKIAERKSALKKSQREANRKATQQQRTTLKPPSNKEVEPRPDATSRNGKATVPTQDRSQELTDATAQSEKPTTQDNPKQQTDTSLQNKNSTPINQVQTKVTSQQQQTAKTSEAKSKQQDRRNQKQPLLPGNGTHRAWCRIPGIIRAQESEEEGERPAYCLEIDGHQLPLSVKNRFAKLIEASLDQPLMVRCYPRIFDGQIALAQFCGTNDITPDKPEDWLLIGVWDADQQRVLVQRDRKQDSNRRILQLSPLVREDCLEKLEGRKLYHFECQREGSMVTVVGVEALQS
ncbi:hypothetical protein ON05_031630 (plasmid) [Acaryochloris sp. CCMEE 5410]|nr:hypothetical protein ON05_031630 [Acaryochloris sp. CCMEE 5410]